MGVDSLSFGACLDGQVSEQVKMATQRDYFGDSLTPAQRAERKRLREEKQALENRRLGLLVFQISWIMAFVALIVVNWQLRFQYESWPPPGVPAMGTILSTAATVGLLAAVILARIVRRRVAGDQAYLRLWEGAIALVAAFIAIMAYEWITATGADTQYRAVFRLMTGFHSLHALAVGIYMINAARSARQGRFSSSEYWGLESGAKMLDFVFVAWMLFYVVLYWWRT